MFPVFYHTHMEGTLISRPSTKKFSRGLAVPGRQEVHRSATWRGPSSQPPGRGTREPGEWAGFHLRFAKVADLRVLRPPDARLLECFCNCTAIRDQGCPSLCHTGGRAFFNPSSGAWLIARDHCTRCLHDFLSF
jgi:hypothetical protein